MPVENPVLERRTPLQESNAKPKDSEAPKGIIAQRLEVYKLEFAKMASMTTAAARESNPGTTSAMCSTC